MLKLSPTVSVQNWTNLYMLSNTIWRLMARDYLHRDFSSSRKDHCLWDSSLLHEINECQTTVKAIPR